MFTSESIQQIDTVVNIDWLAKVRFKTMEPTLKTKDFNAREYRTIVSQSYVIRTILLHY